MQISTLNKYFHWFLLLSILFFNGCLSLKSISAQSGASSLYETFFVGELGTQYFIKPISFKEVERKDKIFLDFTFRYKNIIEDSAIINFSVNSTEIFKNVDSLEIKNEIKNISSNKLKLMYNEKLNKKLISRFSCNILLEDVCQIFKNENWHINIYIDSVKYSFYSSKKTKKTLKKVCDNLFILF